MEARGLEPLTSRVWGERSSQLSYASIPIIIVPFSQKSTTIFITFCEIFTFKQIPNSLFSSSIFFLIIHTVQHHSTPPPPLANAQQPPLASLLQATLCGRLGEALKSDAYVDFREGQPTLVNLVEVSG